MTATVEAVARPATKRIAPFPHHYELSVTAAAEGQGRIHAGQRPEIVGGPPAQFGGRDDWWSPEHLLLGAVSLCLLTTFRALADARGVSVIGYSSLVKGILDRTAEGRLHLDRARRRVDGAGGAEGARRGTARKGQAALHRFARAEAPRRPARDRR